MLTTLTVGGPVQPWVDFGLALDPRPQVEAEVVIAGLRLVIDPAAPAGLRSWGGESVTVSDIDGVPTNSADSPAADTPGGVLRVTAWDHVVIMTNNLERTCAAVEAATQAPLKRVREVGPVRQGFHRWGRTIVEVVESSQVVGDGASLWGFVWTVADLDAEVARLGRESISPPKAAVQPGRRVATVRAAADLGVAVALMSP